MITSTHKLGITSIKDVTLSVDKCISKDKHKDVVAQSILGYVEIVAHTHACRDDPNFGVICLPRWGILNIRHQISDILWHEYGHFIDTRKFTCKLANSYRNNEEWSDYVHNETFREIMSSLGKERLSTKMFFLDRSDLYEISIDR